MMTDVILIQSLSICCRYVLSPLLPFPLKFEGTKKKRETLKLKKSEGFCWVRTPVSLITLFPYKKAMMNREPALAGGLDMMTSKSPFQLLQF